MQFSTFEPEYTPTYKLIRKPVYKNEAHERRVMSGWCLTPVIMEMNGLTVHHDINKSQYARFSRRNSGYVEVGDEYNFVYLVTDGKYSSHITKADYNMLLLEIKSYN